MTQAYILRKFVWSLAILSTLLLLACGGGGTSSGSRGSANSDLQTPNEGDLRPAKSGSPYANVLVECVTAESDSESCRLTTLPFLSSEPAGSTVTNIMNRTVVSHEWMGTRFEELLREMPQDLLTMMDALTAVVISYDVRPSFYTTLTGAMYLDPANIWLTVEEKQTINTDDDYRSDFNNELQFLGLWRYIKNGDYAFASYSLTDDSERALGDIVEDTASLLFHELTHANDFFPPSLHSSMNTSSRIVNLGSDYQSQRLSVHLYDFSPLTSDTLLGLGQVQFFGQTATDTQKNLTPSDVGFAFASEGASDNYAYATQYEDFAMLIEEIMMKYHFDIDRDVAFTNSPETPSCSNVLVAWGVRNRIADPSVKARARYALQQLLQTSSVENYLTPFTSVTEMRNNESWCTNLIAESSEKPSSDTSQTNNDLRELALRDRLPPRHSGGTTH